MSDINNGAGPSQPSLREIAEQAYDDLERGAEEAPAEAQEGSEQSEEPLASDDRPRDKQGRWVPKSSGAQTGEAIERPLAADPAPKKPEVSETRAEEPDPAAQARSNQVPEHWSAEDKATFAKLPQEGQAFLLRRHGEMEAEFTRKSQASAGAVQFTQSLAPVFTDRRIQTSLQQMGLNPTQAIQEWAGLHVRAMSPNQQDRFSVLVDMTERMGLDPARIFVALNKSPLPEGLAEAELKDPAVKFFADRLGQTTGELNALKGEINQIQRERAQLHQARMQEGEQHARANIDQFADETGADGKPLRPHFNAVLPILLDLYKANPQRSLTEAYDAACWSHPEVRKQLLAAEHQRQQSQHDIQKAKIAQRGNTRGLTSPAVKPPGANGLSRGSIRDTIEQSAEEIGF
jgi:hypothetical protein